MIVMVTHNMQQAVRVSMTIRRFFPRRSCGIQQYRKLFSIPQIKRQKITLRKIWLIEYVGKITVPKFEKGLLFVVQREAHCKPIISSEKAYIIVENAQDTYIA